jgi:hypothetical protein
MAGWMINCKEYAEKVSRSLDCRLTFWDRMSMKIHQVLCPPCKHIRQQFNAIRNACQLEPTDEFAGDTKNNRLSEEVCERIKAALMEEAKAKDL